MYHWNVKTVVRFRVSRDDITKEKLLNAFKQTLTVSSYTFYARLLFIPHILANISYRPG